MSKHISALLLIFLINVSDCQASDNLNVGTTLFAESDIYKQCWSSENIAILTTRMILEDLLPSTTVLNIEDNDFVNDIIQYFRLVLEIVRKQTYGKTKHITLIALTDLLGGYLNHAILPIARYAYYAGMIDYISVEKLMQLFDELKWFLRTNGQGWAHALPQDPSNYNIEKIPIQMTTTNANPCNGIIYYDDVSCPVGKPHDVRHTFVLPLPFFDARCRPSSIAVPFKAYPLRNIESKCAAYVVMKYYIAGFRCLVSKGADARSQKIFKDNLFTWIGLEVMPKLNDDRFYAAFGGVLRVRDTLRRSGASETDLQGAVRYINQLAGKKEESLEGVTGVGAQPGPNKGGGEEGMSKKSLIIWILLVLIAIWFMLGTAFICYRMRNKDKRFPCSKSSKTEPSSSQPSSTDSKKKKPFKMFLPCSRSISPCTRSSDAQAQYACHSSLTGDYLTEGKTAPFIYDSDEFETTSEDYTSRASEGASDGKSAAPSR